MKLKTWKWVATTKDGIYHGQLTGEQEKGETDKQAMESVSSVVKDFLRRENRGNVIACFVSETAIHIDAPNTGVTTLDIKIEFHVNELDESQALHRTERTRGVTEHE